jgi:hypothetical protein
MAPYYRIREAVGRKYIIDRWDEPDRSHWPTPQDFAWKREIPETAAVGDVLTDDPLETSNEDIGFADEEITAKLAALTEGYDRRLEALAERHGVSIDTEHTSLEDGDIVFISPEHRGRHYRLLDDIAYASPEGVISEGHQKGIRNDDLLNCPADTLESGMVFDVLHRGTRPYGLRFNREKTADLHNDPSFVRLLSADFSWQDGIESVEDLQPPLYVSINGYDDGQYYTGVYDSADPPPEESFANYRYVFDATARMPYRIRKRWTDADLVEVEELYLESNQYADYPVVTVAWDADVIEDATKRWE